MTRGAHMVDVGSKPDVPRRAIARASLRLRPATLRALRNRAVPKGDALEVARAAGILAAKQTPLLLPLCHPIPLDAVRIDFTVGPKLRCEVEVEARYRTGVEMEALTACSVALLTVWDFVKPLEKDGKGQYPTTRIEDLRVVSKVKG